MLSVHDGWNSFGCVGNCVLLAFGIIKNGIFIRHLPFFFAVFVIFCHSYPRFPSLSFSFLLSILSPTQIYQFLLLLIFINSSSHPNLSIPPPIQIYQFLLLLIFINSSCHPNLSILPLPYFSQFPFFSKFINSSLSESNRYYN